MRKFLHILKEGAVFTYGAIAGKKVELTSGSINRSIFSLAIPMVMELVMESVFVSVNLLIIAKLGDKVLGLVGITDNYINFAYAIAVGLGIAAATLTARRAGEKDKEGMGRTAQYIILLALFFAVLIGGVSCFFASEIVDFLGINASTVTDGISFSRLVFLSIGLVILRLSVNGLFRGAGDADIAMKSLWICHISNIIFAVILVFGLGFIPAFGLMGLAYATILSRLLGVLYQAFVFATGKTSIIIRVPLQLDIPLLQKILKLAFGGLVQYIIPTSSWLIMVKIISTFGTTALAGYIIAQRIASVATMPAWGIGNAAGVLTGQNLGAGEPERAEKTVWRAGTINMTYLVLVALFWQIAAEYVVKVFHYRTGSCQICGSIHPCGLYGVSAVRIHHGDQPCSECGRKHITGNVVVPRHVLCDSASSGLSLRSKVSMGTERNIYCHCFFGNCFGCTIPYDF